MFLRRKFAFVIGVKKIFVEDWMDLMPQFVQFEMV